MHSGKWKRILAVLLAAGMTAMLAFSGIVPGVLAEEDGASGETVETVPSVENQPAEGTGASADTEPTPGESKTEESPVTGGAGADAGSEEISAAAPAATEAPEASNPADETVMPTMPTDAGGEKNPAQADETIAPATPADAEAEKTPTPNDEGDNPQEAGEEENAVPEEEKEQSQDDAANTPAMLSGEWTVTQGVVSLSGVGAAPSAITVERSDNRSTYTGEKFIVFGYQISSDTEIDGPFKITVTDCGIMSDDASIEIWKRTADGCQKLDSDVAVLEGSLSFETDGLGEFFAVSSVATVDLSKGDVQITSDAFEGTQQDGSQVAFAFQDMGKYRISQSESGTRSKNNVKFETASDYTAWRTIILDGVNTEGEVSIPARVHTVLVTLLLRNVNQLRRIYYGSGTQTLDSANKNSRLTIDSYENRGGTSGELYIPYKMGSQAEELAYITTPGIVGAYWSQAGIGGGRDQELKCCTGLTIAGGTLRVLGQNGNGATAIGGGGNGDAELSITGGSVTAICSSTGSAIGGGIGWINRGGNAEIRISGGVVYAENVGYYTRDNISYGGVAIGSGSSMQQNGNAADITISGGSVTAYARYGNGIGSGNSYQGTAAKATISISGNANVTTNALGGGTSKENKGGDAEITVANGATVNCVKYSEITDKWDTNTDNILDAFGIGGGSSAGTAKGGSAVVNVSGGTVNCNGGNIGGGAATGTGDGGDASIYVSGGTLNCASIGGGNSVSGKPGSVTSDTQPAGVVVTGGTLNTGTIGGGTNEKGAIGFATAEISGGQIQGRFILSNTDTTKKCFFRMTGGTIDNAGLPKDGGESEQRLGGAVYLSDPNGEVTISGGVIQNSDAAKGGAVYMTAGAFTLSGTGALQNCNAAQTGGAVHLENGSVKMTGGQILNCKAAEGGGAYLADGSFTLSGGVISGNIAENGAGAYLQKGNLTLSGSGKFDKNTASQNGGGAYLAGGALTVDGGAFHGNIASKDGGGAYLTGGTLTINGGAFDSNTAQNGGGAYAADGKVRMFGGSVAGNCANQDGGGLYVSSDVSAADVVIRSGSVTGNTSGGNGGGIAVVNDTNNTADAVILGLLEKHGVLDENRGFTPFSYTDAVDNSNHTHASCPILSGNQAENDGGGIYMSSSAATLQVYCLTEKENLSKADANGNGVMTVGGTVTIGDSEHNDENARGNIVINSAMLVEGGKVDIYGNMQNPLFENNILVDIQANAGTFEDHRKQNSTVVSYKVHYFENFTNGGAQPAAGLYTAMQYDTDEQVSALGTLFTHPGWKIVGWDTKADGKGTRYSIGSQIGNADDHNAWKSPNEALILYAIWQRTGYTVAFNPGGTSYTGTMENQQFEYGVAQQLTANAFRITGKRFIGWNTQANGQGTAYAADYSESQMTAEDGVLVTLYAQWVDCTHLNGDHPGTVTYTVADSEAKITETCDCGYTASVTLSAVSAYYDQKTHPAQLAYAGALLEGAPAISYQYRAAETGDYGPLPTGETVPVSVGNYKASITLGGKTVFVEYAITSPTEGTSLNAKAAAGQYFADFNGGAAATISQNDAVTVQFDVLGLNTEVYQTVPILSVGAVLPSGTTIILQTGEGYWYAKSPSGTEIALTEFTRMGGTEKFTYIPDANQSYRFIVNFSQASEKAGSREVSLTYTPTGASGNLGGSVTLTMQPQQTFAVTASGSSLTIQAPAANAANRWYGKELTLVLSAPEGTPADAALTVTIGEKTSVFSLNARRQFVVPLTWAESQNVILKLDSTLAAHRGSSYNLMAELYTGLSGQKLSATGQNATVALTIPADTTPSLKLSGTARVVSAADQTLTLTAAMQNTAGCTVSAVIQKKAGSAYSGNYLSVNDLQAGEQQFSLAAITEPGSYRIYATVSKNGTTLLNVPYYFIVK